MTDFCSLHNHSDRSNVRMLDCICKPKDLVNRAISLGYKGMALTDHECLSAAVEMLKIRDKIKEEHPDFKIIMGNEIYLIGEDELHNAQRYYHFILLAKDEIGWRQLRELSSRAWDRGYMERGMMRVPTTYKDIEEIIGKEPGHILGSTACLGGQLNTAILNHDVAQANNFIKWCISMFQKENFFLELQPSDSEEQVRCNEVLLKLAKSYGLKHIITTDTHYLNKEDFGIHAAFLNSRQAKDRETEKFYRYTYMMPTDEIVEILKKTGISEEDIYTGFENTMYIYDQVETYDFRHSTIVPHAKIPDFKLVGLFEEHRSRYPCIDEFLSSEEIDNVYLMYLIEKGIIEKHIDINELRLSRIETELSVIKKVSAGLNQTVSSYFLLMREVIDIAWNYSTVAPGRGSSGGFYINYLIDLIQVDPLKYNLPHWRLTSCLRQGALL